MVKNISKHLKLTWLGEWEESLIGCPSQLYRDFKVERGQFQYREGIAAVRQTEYLLRAKAYCRWRWSDPWTASVMSEDEATSRLWIADCIQNVPSFCEPEHKELETWVEENFPKQVAEIVEAGLREEQDDLRQRQQSWEKLKVELGIVW